MFTTLALLLSLTIVIFFYTNIFQKTLYKLEVEAIKKDVLINSNPFIGGIDKLTHDVKLLSSLPEIKEILYQDSKVSRKALEFIFKSVLSANPDYFQISIILNRGKGKELVRVERSGQEVVIIPEEDRQEKGS